MDCGVFIQAAISDDGPAAACLSLAESGQVELLVSPVILVELRETPSRPNLLRRFPHLTDERVEANLMRVAQLVGLIQDVAPVFSQPRDPDDALYVDLASSATASFIVSRDKDLLDLTQDATFRATYPTIAVLNPPTFLEHVRA